MFSWVTLQKTTHVQSCKGFLFFSFYRWLPSPIPYTQSTCSGAELSVWKSKRHWPLWRWAAWHRTWAVFAAWRQRIEPPPPCFCQQQHKGAIIIIIIIMRLKALPTGATRTLTWITHVHSHTYINIVTTTLCEAPAQLLQNLESNFFFEGTWHITKILTSLGHRSTGPQVISPPSRSCSSTSTSSWTCYQMMVLINTNGSRT